MHTQHKDKRSTQQFFILFQRKCQVQMSQLFVAHKLTYYIPHAHNSGLPYFHVEIFVYKQHYRKNAEIFIFRIIFTNYATIENTNKESISILVPTSNENNLFALQSLKLDACIIEKGQKLSARMS